MLHPAARLAAPRRPARRTARDIVRHLVRHPVRVGSRALITGLTVLAAAATGAQVAGATAFGGASLRTGALGAWLRPHVAEAAAGSVSASLARALGAGPGGTGPNGSRRASSTFARRLGGAPRDAATGTGRVDLTGSAPAPAAPLAPDARRPAAARTVRQQLADAASGTYIGELLARRDSALTRWPDRPDRPLAVFVANGAGLADWRPEYVGQVAAAFAAWSRAGVPLQFRLVTDSARADVHVAWIDHFRESISGRTVWSRDERWWMLDATVTLALHHSDGAPLDDDQVRAIALHEVGHLIGLDHTADSLNVMAPRVRVRDLSPADQATARLLYAVPAGRVR